MSTTRRWLMAAALVVSSAVTAVLTSDGTVEANVAFRQIDLPTAGEFGPVTIIGDSVLLGSALWGPTLPDRLVEQGWGPIKFRAGRGYNATGTSTQASTFWIRQWRAEGWDAPNVLVNIGANDSGTCGTNIDCARQRIGALVAEIGPGRQIWWPKITRLFTHFDEQNTWNQALQEFADASEDFHTWEWPAELGQYESSDGTHLNPDGYRRRSVRMAELFTLDMARGTQRSADVTLPEAQAAPSSFVAIPAARVVDTRRDSNGRRTNGTTLRIDLSSHVPDNATAVALYLGAASASGTGFFAAGPCGEPTSGSTVNFTDGPAAGAPTIVALGDERDVCVFTRGEAELIVDLQGAFAPSDALTFSPLGEPQRLVDTRQSPDSDRSTIVEVQVPPGAEAVALNLTAVRPSATGFLSAAPCGEPGEVANVNFRAGNNAAAFAIVNVSDDDTVCVERSVDTDVVVDITGSFTSGDGLRFVPVSPTRMLDTRRGIGGFSPIHGSGQTAQMRVAPPAAAAVTGTLTLIKPLAGSFLSADACIGDVTTSSVNAANGSIVANSITTAVNGSGRLCVTAFAAGHTVFDTTGWWI